MTLDCSRICMLPERNAESVRDFLGLPLRKQRALYAIALERLKWFPERAQYAGFWRHLSASQVVLLGRSVR